MGRWRLLGGGGWHVAGQGKAREEISLRVRILSLMSWMHRRDGPGPGTPAQHLFANSRQGCTPVLGLMAEAGLDWGPGL